MAVWVPLPPSSHRPSILLVTQTFKLWEMWYRNVIYCHSFFLFFLTHSIFFHPLLDAFRFPISFLSLNLDFLCLLTHKTTYCGGNYCKEMYKSIPHYFPSFFLCTVSYCLQLSSFSASSFPLIMFTSSQEHLCML